MGTTLKFAERRGGAALHATVTILFERDGSLVDQLGAVELPFESTTVCLDFENRETVDSAELSALVRFALQLRQLEKTVSICNVGTHLGDIFDITRFGAWTVS